MLASAMLRIMNDTVKSEPSEAIDALSFEDALKHLETVVHQLESGEVPLDKSITLYEKGEALRLHCQKRLEAAQARIEKITLGKDGKPSGTQPFDSE